MQTPMSLRTASPQATRRTTGSTLSRIYCPCLYIVHRSLSATCKILLSSPALLEISLSQGPCSDTICSAPDPTYVEFTMDSLHWCDIVHNGPTAHPLWFCSWALP